SISDDKLKELRGRAVEDVTCDQPQWLRENRRPDDLVVPLRDERELLREGAHPPAPCPADHPRDDEAHREEQRRLDETGARSFEQRAGGAEPGVAHLLRLLVLVGLVVLVEHHPGVEELLGVGWLGAEEGAREAYLLGAPGLELAGFLEPALHDVGAERAVAQGAQSG